MIEVERVQTGIRIEKRLLKVLKALAELKDLSVGDLLEGIVLHAFEGKIGIFQGNPGANRRVEKNLSLGAPRRRQPSTEGKTLSSSALLHTREQFSLAANAPFEIAWPLFGADKERAWAPDWQPIFLWPENAFDQEGMVFKVAHEDKSAIWVNTAFDRTAGRIQYVYVIPDVVVTVITLKLTARGGSTTIDVLYERTALVHAANDMVKTDGVVRPPRGQRVVPANQRPLESITSIERRRALRESFTKIRCGCGSCLRAISVLILQYLSY